MHIHDLVDNVTMRRGAGEGGEVRSGPAAVGHVIPTAAGRGSAMWCHRRCMRNPATRTCGSMRVKALSGSREALWREVVSKAMCASGGDVSLPKGRVVPS